MYNLNLDKIEHVKGYAGCEGIAPPGDPIYSHSATVSMGGGVVGDDGSKAPVEHPKINVPDNVEFRAIYDKHAKEIGMTDEEIKFAKKYLAVEFKAHENFIVYCNGDVKNNAESLAEFHFFIFRTQIDHLRSRGYEPEEMFATLEG